jgi:hypothetical protein
MNTLIRELLELEDYIREIRWISEINPQPTDAGNAWLINRRRDYNDEH